MSYDPTADYFLRREARQRAMASAATSPRIRAIHLDMANRYAALAADDAVAISANRLVLQH